ncbi:MAG: hypothetical protein BGO03_03275 [Mesorhizobium sp. 61-13]|nr:MAG: hypothetical protein BGO03_03275 [Mesorhizobium sp. 61-13]
MRNAHPGYRRNRDDLEIRHPRSKQEVRNLVARGGEPVRSDEIGFREGDNAIANTEQIKDGDMLGRLGHDSVVCGHDKNCKVDAGRTGKHVADETLMSRHIDKADRWTVCHRHVGKTDVDRNASRLFFLQPIRINSGQGAN